MYLDGGMLRIGDRQNGTIVTEEFKVERDDVFRAEHEAFFQAVDGEREPETSAADGIVSVAVCEAAMASLDKRIPVELCL